MKRKRRHLTAEFKARVALEAIKGEKTAGEIARENDIAPAQICEWKKRLEERLGEVFQSKGERSKELRAQEQKEARDGKGGKGVMQHFLTHTLSSPFYLMPRIPRVEYEGAVYHVMARGDRREPIVLDDVDRTLFFDTFGEACGRTGWEVFAWVLLNNHYHAVFRTPEPNLVAGMKWFQNAFTRRINARHRLWGHLFGGRYKAIPIEDEATSPDSSTVWQNYLRSVVDYVHLNPARSGLVDGSETGSLDYPWSSLSKGYSLSPAKRCSWMAVQEGLDLFEFPDSVAGRRRYIERLDAIARDENGDPLGEDEAPISKRFERGWFWGSESFRERLNQRIESLGSRTSRNYRSRSEGPASDHGRKRAETIIREGANHYGMSENELCRDRRGDWRRSSVAWAVAMETSVPQAWIADRLNLKSAANASQQIRRFRSLPDKELPRKVKRWKLSRNVA